VTEHTALAVMPQRPSAPAVVMTLTAAHRWHGLTKLFAGVGVLDWRIGLLHERPSCASGLKWNRLALKVRLNAPSVLQAYGMHGWKKMRANDIRPAVFPWVF
jgi:hypothetical protein